MLNAMSKNASAQNRFWWQGSLMIIKARAADTAGVLGITEGHFPEGFGPPLHVHHREDETIYVLEGRIRFRQGDEDFVAGPGTLVWGPRGVPHAFIWVRLTHVECLEYARARWLEGVEDNAEVEKRVSEHFFADTVARRRDDNPVSRLWWNAYIANMIEPDGNLAALDQFLRKADIRLNTVERSLTFYRQPLAAGIIRLMRREPWVSAREEDFRAFMRVINRLGGGLLFEAMSPAAIDTFMDECAVRAGLPAKEQKAAAAE